MTELDEQDLRDAAAEVGLSPRELETALAERRGGLPAVPDETGVVGRPDRGETAVHAEGRVAAPTDESVDLVRAAVEKHVGSRGHRHGNDQADVVDDKNGVTYRLKAVEDGAGGAIVRVDVDPSQLRANRTLVATGTIGVAATVGLVGWVFGATALVVGAAVLAGLGAFGFARGRGREQRAVRDGFAVASRALAEAETRRPPPALPSADADEPG